VIGMAFNNSILHLDFFVSVAFICPRLRPTLVSEYVRCETVGPYQVTYPMAGEQKVGGPVRNLEWDCTGERLAVTFSGEEQGTELIALYATRLHPFLQFTPR